MWIVVCFASLGFLIGNLVALTSESAVTPILSLLFAFVGGSVLAFLHKLNENDRGVAGKSVLSLSACCVLGVYVGIWVNQHRLLSPPSRVMAATAPQDQKQPSVAVREDRRDDYYLRSSRTNELDLVDRRKQQRLVSTDEAYEQVYELARKHARELDQLRSTSIQGDDKK
jgi:hypothetical protein